MRRKSKASALLACFIGASVIFGVTQHTDAAPIKDQAAADYLINASQTHWSAQALYILGEENIPEGNLKDTECDSAILCAGPILGITALGQDPRSFAKEDLVAKLLSFSANNQLGDPTYLNDDIFGILALIASGVPSDDASVAGSKTFLLQNQNSDGGFGWIVGSSDVDDTAMAVMALIEAGVSKIDPGVQNAIFYIKQSQNADGGFPYDPVSPWGTNSNANTTAWVMSMAYKLGEDPESESWSKNWNTPAVFLKSLQTPEGWFEYELGGGNALPVDTTAQAAIALAGGSYPVRKIVYTPPAPPSPPPPPPAGMIFPTVPSSGEEEKKELNITEPETKTDDEKEPEEKASEPETLSTKTIFYENGALLKTPDDPTVYIIENGRKRWIPNEIILRLQFPSPRIIEFVEDEVLAQYPEGLEITYPDGVYLIGATNKKAYLIKRGKKYHVRSKEAWARILAQGGISAITVSDEEFIKYETGGMVE